MNIKSTCLLAALLSVAQSWATTWVPWNGHEYTLVPVSMNWDAAQANADLNMSADSDGSYVGGRTYLVSINSAAEEEFLHQAFCTDAHGAWIGLRQTTGAAEPDQGWVWISGEPVTFTNWHSGEPNNSGSGENWATWGCNGGTSWWNDEDNDMRWSLVEREGPACDLCNAANGCDYTCLDVNNLLVSPNPVAIGCQTNVTFDYSIHATNGHVLFIGLTLDGVLVTTLYSGIPGENGVAGTASASIAAPSAIGSHNLGVAVAHVLTEQDLRASIEANQADTLLLRTLVVTPSADINGDGIVDLVDLSILLGQFGATCD